MCERLKAEDPQIRRLCDEIKASQKTEIALMKSMLDRKSSQAEAAPSD